MAQAIAEGGPSFGDRHRGFSLGPYIHAATWSKKFAHVADCRHRGLISAKVEIDLMAVLHHCRCAICMGIVKNTRAISACMHRFCKDCIEAWLQAQIDNRHCPQCRVKFSSKRDCKPDPNFDLLLAAVFGDVEEFERHMLEPTAEVLHRDVQLSSSKQPPQAADAAVHERVVRPAQDAAAPPAAMTTVAGGAASGTRPAPPRLGDAKRQKLAGVGDLGPDDDGNTQYRGVRFQGDNWQARTKRNGKEVSLGLYNTAEEAGMAYDVDRLMTQGGKAQRLNFPLLRKNYKEILADLAGLITPDGLLDFLAVAVQAAVSAARNMPGATAPGNTGPAAASSLHPRRPSGLPSMVPMPAQETIQQERPIEEAATGGDASMPDCRAEEQAALLPVEAEAAHVHAEQLEISCSLAAGLALCSTVHVRLETGSGLSWRMSWLACPLGTTVGQVTEAVAAGLEQQYGLPAGSAAVRLSLAIDGNATAALDALQYEDAATGMLLLPRYVNIRDLLTVQKALRPAELRLEYHASIKAASDLGLR